jgi:hypothetical protein
LSTDKAVYADLIDGILKENGLDGVKAEIRQVLSVDLEGDGIDEILINASNLDFEHMEAYCAKGTYSIIILLRNIDGNMKHIVLRQSAYPEDGELDGNISVAYSLSSILDLNGDGIMEVIVGDRYYEGHGFGVFEIRGDEAAEVLSNGWGL